MEEHVVLELNDTGFGHFFLVENNERLGEMEISISGSSLTVFHTEVAAKAEGKGYAKKLLNYMVAHARKHHLKLIPLCPFVRAQFERHPDEYADVWQKH